MMHRMVVFSGVVTKKKFIPVSPVQSGFIVRGDVKDMSLLTLANGEKIIIAAVNNDSLRVFRVRQ